ncbi:hypothetical protein J1614_007975 [Plenodomus biglobosus]|nr:hypothetical protein J1614_007975 [Plenodomus biglobosus]
MSGSACFRTVVSQRLPARGAANSACSWPHPRSTADWTPHGPTANPAPSWPKQTLIICSLHGLFWAADRDETSTAQQSGRGPAVSTRIPFESGVVVNVPALLHGTVMPLPVQPIYACQSSGPWPRGQQSANSGARNARPSVDQQPFAKDVSLGTGAKHPSLTSRRYRVPSFGKGSRLQLANATVVLENGHGLSRANTDYSLWG